MTVSPLYGRSLLRPSSQPAALASQGSTGRISRLLPAHLPPLLLSTPLGHLLQSSVGIEASSYTSGYPRSLLHSVPPCYPQLLVGEVGCAIQAEGHCLLGLARRNAIPCDASELLGSRFHRSRSL